MVQDARDENANLRDRGLEFLTIPANQHGEEFVVVHGLPLSRLFQYSI